MPEQAKREKLQAFYHNLCVSFFGGIRALGLYPPDHPETGQRLAEFFKRLTKYLHQKPSLTLLFVNGEVAVEGIPLPDLTKTVTRLLQRLEAAKFQRIQFRSGVTSRELTLFLEVFLPLLKNPADADLILAKNQDRLPHIVAGALPFEAGPELSSEEAAGGIQSARESMLSFCDRFKGLFAGVDGPLPEEKVSMAREATETLQTLVATDEIPLKILIYRRNTDPDPYIHAVNVSALSMALAQRLELEEATIVEIGLGGLLHDMGLHVSPPLRIIRSPATTLDENKRRWEHPIRGAEVLLATPGLPDLVPLIAYEHHLHYDGGGYPRQERRREPNLASMITSIANSYDNLRRNRPERAATSLTNALNWMDRQGGTYFHPLLLRQFRAMVKVQAREGQ